MDPAPFMRGSETAPDRSGTDEAAEAVRPGKMPAFARIVTHLGWIVGGKGYGAILSLLYLALLTRALGVEAYGSFALILSSTLILQALLNFNIWQMLVKYGQEHIHRGDAVGLARLIRFCTIADLAMATTSLLLAALLLYFGANLFGLAPDLVLPTLAYAGIFLFSIRNVPRGVLRLHSQFSWAFFAEAVVPTLKMLGCLAAYFTDPSLPAFLLIWAGSEMASTLVFWWLACRSFRLAHGKVSARHWMLAWSENDGLPSLLFASNFGTVTYTVTQQLPVLLVGFFAGASEVGLYRLAHQVAQSITLLAGFVSLASYTEMANAHAREGIRGVIPLYTRLTKIMLLLFLVVVPIIVLLGKPVLLLISGQEFAGAYPFLVILSLAACLQMATANCEPMLMASGRAGSLILIRFAGAAALIAATYFMLPIMGAIGAAWAKFAAETFGLLLLFGASLAILREGKSS
ncbi:lipopolysaccharide biosynthesis protein [Sphingomonas crocodyli]|uniref:Lipopolysaccharide biosynthesis protein n=1 Tax=Sphingomonas crocodyli TaxID=1979270 RepID=A0A437M621_9SPHN|nr:oligosaccharide flippase family protein [Sphingomonas crocodyli]RVT93089.1 hypothetical protein EOD43_04105 [Sphingomonas crocodyli]